MVIQRPKSLMIVCFVLILFEVCHSQELSNFGHVKSALRNMMISPSEVYYEEDLINSCFCNSQFSDYEILSEVPDSNLITSDNVHLYRFPDVQNCTNNTFPALKFDSITRSISSVICSNAECLVSCRDFQDLVDSVHIMNNSVNNFEGSIGNVGLAKFRWWDVRIAGVKFGINTDTFFVVPENNVLCNSEVGAFNWYRLARVPDSSLVYGDYVTVTPLTRCVTTLCRYDMYVYFPGNSSWYNAICTYGYGFLPDIRWEQGPVGVLEEQ